MSGPSFSRFRALGTSVVVGSADPDSLARAVEAVRDEVEACDASCSRFRDDSELSRLNEGEHLPRVSRWLCEAVVIALAAARNTDGLVDPTIGQCLIDLGYDRSFDTLDPRSTLTVTATHVPAWQRVRVDPQAGRVFVPPKVRLDLGATAKALCADRAAAQAAAVTRAGVLVSLGGDIAVAGKAPEEGWIVRVADRCDEPPDAPEGGQTVAVRTGGVATSGTAVRRWARAGAVMHHLVDPRTGRPAQEAWKTISVAAPTCVAANIASTAAMIVGPAAPGWLEERGFDARLVTPSGDVVRTGDWPVDPAATLQARP